MQGKLLRLGVFFALVAFTFAALFIWFISRQPQGDATAGYIQESVLSSPSVVSDSSSVVITPSPAPNPPAEPEIIDSSSADTQRWQRTTRATPSTPATYNNTPQNTQQPQTQEAPATADPLMPPHAHTPEELPAGNEQRQLPEWLQDIDTFQRPEDIPTPTSGDVEETPPPSQADNVQGSPLADLFEEITGRELPHRR